MRCRSNPAARCCRANDLPVISEGPEQLDPDLQPNTCVPINGHLASAPRVLSPHRIPNETAAIGYYARQLRRTCRTSNDRKWGTRELLENHGVRQDVPLPNGWRLSCGAERECSQG